MVFEKNMGTADRIIRPAIAAGILAAYASGTIKGVGGKLLLGLSGIFLLTSLVGSCPAYQALDIDSIDDKEVG